MSYYTHHKYKGAIHYVCVDVLSDCSVDWMSYYTHHKYKGTNLCVCVDVLLDYSSLNALWQKPQV
jgi:hypothetical protein